MASYSDITGLSTPAGAIAFNAGTGDTPWIYPDRSTGLGMSEVRGQIDDRGQASGSILGSEFFEKGALLVLAGHLLIRSAATEAGYVAARNALELDMKTKLRALLTGTGTLSFGSGGSIAGVKCNLGAQFPSAGVIAKDFIIGLVAPGVF